ncbi:hypothetical protein B4U80_13300 [Leptotrombidium deliense]|uniref:RRM domain-containing protein n=1 Tax=Leptotrombidium deliense TaxID=299467 RepID=A0A443S8N1_9ACAR|nr:hypothetical protein B4U80_13300 [Leptotrombidium deliense]
MADQIKPLYLARSVKELEQMLKDKSNSLPIPENNFFLRANFAWLEGDQELAFLRYSEVIEKLDEYSTILTYKQVNEVLNRIETLHLQLKSRYEDAFENKKEMTSNDGAINEYNTVHLNNFSPKYNTNLIEGLFSKYGKIKKIWFDVDNERGFGFVEFEQRSSAIDAIIEENGYIYDDYDIIVQPFSDEHHPC